MISELWSTHINGCLLIDVGDYDQELHVKYEARIYIKTCLVSIFIFYIKLVILLLDFHCESFHLVFLSIPFVT